LVAGFFAARANLLVAFLAGAFLAAAFAGVFRAVAFALDLTAFLAAGFALFGAVAFLAAVLRAAGFATDLALARAGRFAVGFTFLAFFSTRALACLSLANSLS